MPGEPVDDEEVNQLRHAHATEVRGRFGLEAALGHTSMYRKSTRNAVVLAVMIANGALDECTSRGSRNLASAPCGRI